MEDSKKPIEIMAMEALGKGFDINGDFILKFAKGGEGGRFVALDDANKRDVVFPGGFVAKGVSNDIRIDKGDRIMFKYDILEFN